MKVMLINPASDLKKSMGKYEKFAAPVLPTGIACIASMLEKNGIDVIVIDQFAEKMSNVQLVKKIVDEKPQIVGFSCLTPAMNNVKTLVHQIRIIKRDIQIVLGNTHATIFADELLRQKIADIVVRREGDYTTLEVALAITKGKGLQQIKGISFVENGKVYHNPEREPIDNLDELPYPAWHLFNLESYREIPLISAYKVVLPIQASRGCPYQCTFCAQDKVFKRPRYRKINAVIDEIEYMHERFKTTFFGFTDAYFPFSVEHGLKFCDEFIRRGLHKKIKWLTETRVNLVSLELLKKMKEAGVYLIMYGFEVGNQKVLDSLKKGATLEQARRAMKATKKAGIKTLGLFMLGAPGETRQTCEETIRFAKQLDCDIAKFNIVIPLPGSKLFEDLKGKIGDIQEPEKFTSWYGNSSSSSSLIYIPEDMTAAELINLQRKAMFQFYMRPRLIIRHIFRRLTSFRNLFYGAYVLISDYLDGLRLVNRRRRDRTS